MKIENITPPTAEEFSKASGVSKSATVNWEKYCLDCRRRAKLISERINLHYNGSTSSSYVLDWGCAAGGVAIALAEELPFKCVYAADLDQHSIKWLQSVNPQIKASILRPKEKLPFDDSSLNIIFGISVFTHISAKDHDFYLEELRRVLAPMGILIITIHGYHACDWNKREGKNKDQYPNDKGVLQSCGLIHISYPKRVLDEIDFVGTSDYGVTYHSPQFVRATFGRYFDIVSFDEGALGTQDMLTLKKV